MAHSFQYSEGHYSESISVNELLEIGNRIHGKHDEVTFNLARTNSGFFCTTNNLPITTVIINIGYTLDDAIISLVATTNLTTNESIFDLFRKLDRIRPVPPPKTWKSKGIYIGTRFGPITCDDPYHPYYIIDEDGFVVNEDDFD